MRRLLFILFIFCAHVVEAQNNSNAVYVREKTPVKIDLPATRTIYGGTIINVTYKGSRISNTIKGAFEYACKLVEETIPTVYPIRLSVEFSNLQDADCLALVESVPADSGLAIDYPKTDRVFVKRYAQTYLLPNFETEEKGVDFFEKSVDANIKFSTRQKFDYSIDTKNINSEKYDFVTVAEQAYNEYFDTGKKSRPISELWKELDL